MALARIRRVAFGGLIVAVLGHARPLSAAINLELRTVNPWHVGDTVLVGLYAVSDNAQPQPFSAVQAVLLWTPTYLRMLAPDQTGAVGWWVSGFSTDACGLNEANPPQDGSGLWTGMAPLGQQFSATPAGTLLTTLRFEALGVTSGTMVDLAASGGNPPCLTQVFGGPGQNVLGTLTDATVVIQPTTGISGQFRISATNSSGSALFAVDANDFSWNPSTQTWSWSQTQPFDLIDGDGDVIGTVQSVSVSIRQSTYLLIQVGLGVVAGNSDTDFDVLSPTLSFAPLDACTATGRATASVSITDWNGNGATVFGLPAGSGRGIFRAQYAAGTREFTDLVASVTAPLGGAGNASETDPPPPASYRRLNDTICDMATAHVFRLTAGDSGVMTTTFRILAGTPPSLGDLNCDGAIDSFDVAPFALALCDPAAYVATYPDCPFLCAGDANADGLLNFFDIDPFVALLMGPKAKDAGDGGQRPDPGDLRLFFSLSDQSHGTPPELISQTNPTLDTSTGSARAYLWAQAVGTAPQRWNGVGLNVQAIGGATITNLAVYNPQSGGHDRWDCTHTEPALPASQVTIRMPSVLYGGVRNPVLNDGYDDPASNSVLLGWIEFSGQGQVQIGIGQAGVTREGGSAGTDSVYLGFGDAALHGNNFGQYSATADLTLVAGPGDVTPPTILSHTPSGLVNEPVDQVDVTFSEAIRPSTFDANDVTLTGPNGSVSVDAPVDQGGNVWRIPFATQNADGTYTLAVGPAIEDLAGNAMTAAYTGTFVIDRTPPTIVAQTPTGVVHEPVGHVDVTFSEPVSAEHCSAADFVLNGPSGPVSVGTPLDVGSNIWRITFAPQTACGAYTLTIAPCFEDAAGNAMSAPYVGEFTIALADLAAGDLVVPPEGYPGQPIEMRWHVTNVGGGPATGLWEDSLYLSDDDQPGNDTPLGCFTRPDGLAPGEWYEQVVQIALPASGAGEYWIVVKTDADDAVAECDESDNALVGGPIVISGPNLRVIDVFSPVEGWTGQPVDISWTVANTGAAAASGAWVDRVYLSSDNQCRTDHLLGEFPYAAGIGVGQSIRRTQTVTVTNGLPDGDYYIVVVTDAGGALPETNESDNCTVDDQPIAIHLTPLPDLQVSLVEAPASAIAGQTISGSWRICNNGAGATDAPYWKEHVVLSPDMDPAHKIRDYGEFLNGSYLAPGECYTETRELELPPGISGPHYVVVQTDSRSQVSESDESNNLGHSAAIQVEYTPPGFLHVESVIIAPAPPTTLWAGQRVDVTWIVRNTGGSTIPASLWGGGRWDDGLALSQTPNWDGIHGYWIGGHQGYHYGPLAMGESYTLERTITLPESVAGTWYVIAVPDCHYMAGGNPWPNSDIPRDQGSAPPAEIMLPPPADLQVSAVDAPQAATAGEPVTVSWTVVNNGANATGGPWWSDAVYLSADPNVDPNTDVLLARFEHEGVLEVGAGYTTSQNVTLPANLSGLSYLFVCTDTGGVIYWEPWEDPHGTFGNIYEGPWEDNNCNQAPAPTQIALPPLPEPPDLQVTALTIPADGISGHLATISWTVQNTGTGGTVVGTWYDGVYLSADTVLDPNADVLLASYPHYGALAVGASYIQTQNVPLPHCVSGPFYLFVVVDQGNAVNETPNEGNNARCSDATIAVAAEQPPDLQPTGVDAPSAAHAGEPIAVGWTVANVGIGPADGWWVDKLYLSMDATLDQSEDMDLVLQRYFLGH